MIYYGRKARETAQKRIGELIVKVSEIPGDVLSFQDASDLHYYLSSLQEAIIQEQKKIDREYAGDPTALKVL